MLCNKTYGNTHLLTCAGCVLERTAENWVVLDHLYKDLETETGIMFSINPVTVYTSHKVIIYSKVLI